MSETRRNIYEIRGAWLGFFGSAFTIYVGLIMGLMNLSILTNFPGTVNEYITYFSMNNGFYIIDNLIYLLPGFYWSLFFTGVVGMFFSLFRTNIGIRLSGFFLVLTSVISMILMALSGIYLSITYQNIVSLIKNPQELATYGISLAPSWMFWGGVAISFAWLIGAFLVVSAAPMNEAKYRTRRMKILASADTAERAGRPAEAIKLYTKAGDLSMTLREEDKATEYYAKAREIREIQIQAVLEAEEKRKREELAARRAKLEEERREILMRADKAEESEDWARAAVIYKEAASLSVDLGEKKLAAQFTAKAKELQKRAKKARKE
ncbi:MAG: hypothetical protein ACTSRS_00940 [Candidatus Helarchaeota archaeon]